MSLRFLLPIILAFCTSAFATRIVFLGDSLTDGYGVARDKAYPALIEKKLKASGNSQVQVINSSVSGATSASTMSRVKWLLKDKPRILVLALGANDGLRGLKVAQTKANLSQGIQLAKNSGIEVVLAGMKMPPNYGAQYSTEFANMFSALAKQHEIQLIPFLLEGVGGEPALNQADGIHPNEKGQEIIAAVVYPYIIKAIRNVK
jgi:acyl-CoA thioesterase I